METLTDPKDPLGILKKPKNSTPTVEEKDPLGILKKKDNTVSEPNSNAGSTQAGLGVSQEPGPKGAKPLGKSTEDNEYTRYFNAYQEKLGKQYSDKLSKEIEPYDQALTTKPDLTNQAAIDEYNRRVNERNAFAEKKAKEYDTQYATDVNAEFERVKGQAEGFEKAMVQYQSKREKPTEESTLTKIVKGDAFLAPIASILTDAAPSAIVASRINTEPYIESVRKKPPMVKNNYGISNPLFQNIERKYNAIRDERGLKKEDLINRAKEIEEVYKKHVGEEQYNKEKALYQINQTNQSLEAFKEMDIQEKERALKLAGLPQTWEDAKGLGGAFLYGMSTVSEVAGQIPLSIGTLGTSTYFMERGDILKEGVDEAAAKKGISTESFIKAYPEELKKISDVADTYGAANAALDLISLGTGISLVAKKALGQKLIKNIIERPGMKVLINVAEVPGKMAGTGTMEGFTEAWQETNTIIATKISKSEATDYVDGFNKLNDEDKNRIEEAGRKGSIGGSVLGGIGSAMTSKPANKPGTKNIVAPPKINPIKPPSQVIAEVRTSVKSADDTQGAEAAAEKILETTQTPNATEGQEPNLQTDGKERNGQGRQEGLLTQETGGWKAGDIIPANYPQPERVIKSIDGDLNETMVKVTFEDGTHGAIQKKKPTPIAEEKPVETKQSTPDQALSKYENDEKYTIDDLVDELESSDDPKIQEAVSKYRADVKEGLEVWGGREDSEARETGFVNEVKKIISSSQQPTPDITTVGDNYVKRDNRWFVKDAEGIERPLISDNPNKTIEEQNTELAQLKELKTQLETQTPVKVDLSPTGKSRIAEMEAFSPEGRVRKWLFGGGQLLWNSKSQGEGKPTLRGLKDETGYSNKERQDIKQYVHDTDGISVEQAAEQLAAQYQDRSPQEYRNAIIEVFSSDPKKWYEQQVRDEDPDYVMQEEQRFQEAGQLNEQIKQLETQEEGIKETNQQLYENERRVNYGSPAAEGQAAGGQMASQGSGGQTQVQPRESIRKNGDANKSKQALEELKSKNLTHVPGLGMGANQAKGTYVSTEEEGSRYARRGTPVKVKVNVQNPFVSEDDVFYDIQREIIQSRFGKEKIEDLTETEADLLAEMVTEHFTTEGFDSIYMPQSETQEGELIVFDRAKVTIMDDARIEYENAVHSSTQTTLQLEFVPDAEFLKTDKPIELREKQKKVRKDLARLNQLIKCR